MTTSSIFYGKIFPAVLMQGYFQAATDLLGLSRIMAYYRISIDSLNIPDSEKYHIKSMMTHYFKFNDPEPLDYSIVSLLYLAVEKDFQTSTNAVKTVSQKIGHLWWLGHAPGWIHIDTRSLHTLFSNAILEEMEKHKYSDKIIAGTSRKSTKEVTVAGLIAFMNKFQELSKIDIDIQRKESSIHLYIRDCPLCLNTSSTCFVWNGILKGFMEWVYGNEKLNRINPTMKINEESTKGHCIVLDLL